MAMNTMKKTKRNSELLVRTLYSIAVAMILTQLLPLLVQFALPGCRESCSDDFELSYSATNNNGTPTPYIDVFPILNISLSLGEERASSLVSSQCYNTMTKNEDSYVLGCDSFELCWTGIKSDSDTVIRQYGNFHCDTDMAIRQYGYPYIEKRLQKHGGRLEHDETPFNPNTEKNKFTVIGCNTLASLVSLLHEETRNHSVGYLSKCDSLHTLINSGFCSRIGYCQIAILKETNNLYVDYDLRDNNSELYTFSHCSYAMVVEETEFKFDTTYIIADRLSSSPTKFPMVVDWAIGNTACDIAQEKKSSYACRSDHSICLDSTSNHGGYLCNCSHGYQGNPYLQGGCQDIDECDNQNTCSKPGKCHNFEGGYHCSCPFGLRSNHNNPTECNLNWALLVGTEAGIVAILFLGFSIYVVVERRKISKLKEKYFQQYGGWILLEKIKSNYRFGFTIFTNQQIEHTTNNFHSANILGHGGQGTVYKGALRDQPVAIKKCKIVDENNKKEFGKEMLILIQINHKNIVKLLGCCLEMEVPILVYELMPNGTLYHYIHSKKQGSHNSLIVRLRIAHESAEALAYLHSSVSPPIYHGDVKSANILLDQNYTAKVSDFGASILAPTDEAQFVMHVKGTWGYLDPEYMQSGQLTDKSDVYSFGVVLLELLTSKPVIYFDIGEEEWRSLSSCFLYAMKENKMQELLDDEIKHEDDMELIREVAQLAKECLSTKGAERPMMKNVAQELHRISKLKQPMYHNEETEAPLIKPSHHCIDIEHTGSYFNRDKEAEESIASGR